MGNTDNLNLETIHMLENFLVLKDIPILAGALFSKAEFLITLDKRDFLDNKKLTNLNLPFKILNPENFIKNYPHTTLNYILYNICGK